VYIETPMEKLAAAKVSRGHGATLECPTDIPEPVVYVFYSGDLVLSRRAHGVFGGARINSGWVGRKRGIGRGVLAFIVERWGVAWVDGCNGSRDQREVMEHGEDLQCDPVALIESLRAWSHLKRNARRTRRLADPWVPLVSDYGSEGAQLVSAEWAQGIGVCVAARRSEPICRPCLSALW
jgi:hypothetical protein